REVEEVALLEHGEPVARHRGERRGARVEPRRNVLEAQRALAAFEVDRARLAYQGEILPGVDRERDGSARIAADDGLGGCGRYARQQRRDDERDAEDATASHAGALSDVRQCRKVACLPLPG